MRRATARTVHAIRRVAVRLGRGCAGASVTAARWTWPRLRRATSAMVRGLGRATVATARWSWDRRRGLARLGHRVLWWSALAILLLVGRALLGSGGDPELLASATIWFATGLSMSVLVLLGAPETRMRVGAFALAGGHGSLALLAVLLG